jgi:hypothetical protein
MIAIFDGHCDTFWRLNAEGKSLKENNLHLDLSGGAVYTLRAVFSIWDTPEACSKRDVFNNRSG